MPDFQAFYQIPTGELRRVTHEMTGDIFGVLETERERLQAHMPWTLRVRTQDDLLRLMVTEREGETRFDYALFMEGHGFCGCLSVIDLLWEQRQCRLQYWLRAGAEGKGFLSGALPVFEESVFGAGIRRIEVLCQEVNPRSIHFAMKNGYAKEGVLRDGVHHLGEFRNVVVLGKVKEGG